MVIKMEGMYVCRMKYPMFLLILKLSESLGYEPVRRTQGVIVWKRARLNTSVRKEKEKKKERSGKTLAQLKEFQSLHFDNTQGIHFSICSDGALNFPKAMDSFPGTSSIPIKHGRKSQTRQIFLQPPISAGSSSIPLRIVTKSCSAFLLHFLCPSKHYQKGILEAHNCNACPYAKNGRTVYRMWLQFPCSFFQENISWLCQDINWSFECT